MAKRPNLTRDTTRTIADALGVPLFERRSHDAKSDAQANLSGRTHYVDADTLRGFRSRISSARAIEHDSVFMIVESVSGDYQHRTRGFRFVAFDLAGTVLNDRTSASAEALHRSSAKAEKDMWEWAESFDARSYYRGLLKERAERMKLQAGEMKKIARAL